MNSSFVGLVEIKVFGFNQLKLLSYLGREKIEIFDLKRITPQEMTFKIKKNKLKFLKKIFKNKNISYQILSYKGFAKFSNLILNNYGIFISCLIFFIFLLILPNFCFKIEIKGIETLNGDQIYQTVDEYISENSYFKQNIDCKEIEHKLKNNFKDISFVSVITRGNYVVADIKEKLTNLETSDDLSNRSAKSTIKGYVQSVTIFQGTSCVKVGDLVDVGDDLILPYVLDSKGNKEYVVPRGEIVVKCFFDDRIDHFDTIITFERTGIKSEATWLSVFGVEIYSKDNLVDYDFFEEETSIQDFSINNILPIKVNRIERFELTQVTHNYNFVDEQKNYLEKARQNVFNSIPENVIIITEREIICNEPNNQYVQYVVEGQSTMTF